LSNHTKQLPKLNQGILATWVSWQTKHSKNMLCATDILIQAPADLRKRQFGARNSAKGQRGFTLVELVMVIILVGILSVVAAPRVFNNNAFNDRSFHDETMAFLRYAQKSAVAQRRTVCVAFSSATATLRIAAAAASPQCDTDLRGPQGDSPGTIRAKAGTVYSTAPTSVHFDGLGQPVNGEGQLLAGSQTVKVNNAANTITVEAVTGYVHD
jgi:MSHA pilin protein MshC